MIAIAIVAIVTLLVTAFGGGDHPTTSIVAPASAARLLPAGPPTLEAVARLGTLTLDLPVNQSRITAIGYFAASDGALGLTPIGTQANQGLLRRLVHTIFGGDSGSPHWYLLPGGDGPSTSALDVGAPPGTDVYSPITGTVVGIEKVILSGKVYGQRIDIQPASSPFHSSSRFPTSRPTRRSRSARRSRREARSSAGCSISPRSRRRHFRATRTTRGTTC